MSKSETEVIIEGPVSKFTLKLPAALNAEPKYVIVMPYGFKVNVYEDIRDVEYWPTPFGIGMPTPPMPAVKKVTEYICQLIRPDGTAFNDGEAHRKLRDVKNYIIERANRLLDERRRQEYLRK